MEQWLGSQALRYGKQLEFRHHVFETDVRIDEIEVAKGRREERVDWTQRIFPKLGFSSQQAFVSWKQKRKLGANYQLLLFAKSPGVSYSMAFANHMHKDLYFVESTILYQQFPNGQPLPTATIAHEFLHLYGAWDLYKTFQQSEAKQAEAEKLFPNDIMLRVSYDIQELEVGPMTAWRIGWSELHYDWYDWFQPKNNK